MLREKIKRKTMDVYFLVVECPIHLEPHQRETDYCGTMRITIHFSFENEIPHVKHLRASVKVDL